MSDDISSWDENTLNTAVILGQEAQLILAQRKYIQTRNNPSTVREYKPEELVFAAEKRCVCGEGMAFPIGSSPLGSWMCSKVLQHKDVFYDDDGHLGPLHFSFYDIQKETTTKSTRPFYTIRGQNGTSTTDC